MVQTNPDADAKSSLINRRQLLQGLGASGVVITAGCLGDDDDDSDDGSGDDGSGDDGDDGDGPDVNPFTNEKFRRGMARLIPREAVIEQIFGGYGVPLGGPIPPGSGTYYDEEHEQELLDEYVGEDPEEAEQLLDEAFDELDLERPFELSFITNENLTRERWMEVVQQTMDDTEFFDANLDIQPFDQLVPFITDPEGASQSTDVVGIGFTFGYDPNSAIEQILHSDYHVPDGFNWNLYENEELDDLIEQGQQELDEEARIEIYKDIQEIIAQDVPSVFMWSSDQIDVVNPTRVENWAAHPNSSNRYWALYRPTVGQVATPADGEGTFTASVGGNPSGFDPTTIDDAPTNATYGSLCYEGLIDVNFAGDSFEACLATDWEQIDDTTWEFEIREGVEFHNGDELTPEDVEFSINRIDGTIQGATVAYIEDTEIDGNTLTVNTAYPYAPILGDIGSVPILPSDVDGISEDPAEDEFSFEEESIGTGPFVLENFATDDRVELTANENYWWDGGDYSSTPPWEEVTFRVVIEQESQHEALLSGELDMIDNAAPWDLERFDGEDAEVVTSRSTSYDLISFPLSG